MKRTFSPPSFLAVLLRDPRPARNASPSWTPSTSWTRCPSTAAQKELDRLSKQWQEEIDERHLTRSTHARLLQRRGHPAHGGDEAHAQEEIEKKEREARDLQKKRFGPNGDLFKKRQELIQPIQDRVYTAVKEVAGTSYVAVFDIGGQGNLLFASEKYDKSDSVLRKLGIRPDKDGDSRSLPSARRSRKRFWRRAARPSWWLATPLPAQRLAPCGNSSPE
jgi:outer membrane protein